MSEEPFKYWLSISFQATVSCSLLATAALYADGRAEYAAQFAAEVTFWVLAIALVCAMASAYFLAQGFKEYYKNE